ncbi:MAG: hypothetical protein C5S47_05155 [Candidatus Methanogasteraceae archaeon]|nr:MAG: hypothetical protein C5S47_05155 [ANME-2 cluster archaeon]
MWFMKIPSRPRINKSYLCHSSIRAIRDKIGDVSIRVIIEGGI